MTTGFQASFDDLSTPLFDVTFCVLDLETTGGSPDSCAITELGAVKYQGGELVGTFSTLVDPGMPIPPSITILTGITHAMVVAAPPVEVVLPGFLEFLRDAVVVGHNVRFDLGFLNAAAQRLGYGRLANQAVDTRALARRLIPTEVRNLRLQTLAAHFRSPTAPIHRALDDAKATAHVFHCLLERAGSLGVTNLDDLLQLPTARGSAHYRKLRLTEHLPRSPGVYVFYDRNGEPIYVGKASNLRTRVRQYFYGDTRRTVANMLRELDQIGHHVCSTEIEAAVTELRLIHAHRPRYNRRSRPSKSAHFLKLTDETYPRLALVRTLKERALAYLGPFRSRRSAEQVLLALWDAVPIRRCTTRPGSGGGPCASAQIGRAICPCDGGLDPARYRETVDRLRAGLDGFPHLLLDPLTARMRRLADQQRYEEAGWLRDRHQALARALEMQRRWRALVGAGLLIMEERGGQQVVIDHGRLVESELAWLSLSPAGADPTSVRSQVPPTLAAAEEAQLVWRWIEATSPRLIEGRLSLPLHPVIHLPVPRRQAA